MKKILVFILTAVICLFSVTPCIGYAQQNNEDTVLKNLIIKIKQELNIPKSYDKFEYTIFNQGGVTTYNFDWKNSSTSESISLNTTTDGYINRYSYFFNEPYPSKRLPSIDEQTALNNAKSFIKSVNPNDYKNIAYTGYKNVSDSNYQFFFIRTVNGVLFPSNYIQMTVDGTTGKVAAYDPTWFQKAGYDADSGKISIEDAFKQFKDKLGLKLAYKLDANTNKLCLVYVDPYTDKAIGALNGEKTDICSDLVPFTTLNVANKQMPNGADKSELDNLSDIISKDQAESKARTAFNISNELKLRSINLYGDKLNNINIWDMSFDDSNINNPSESYDAAFVSVNAVTGEIVSFSKFVEDTDSSVKYDETQLSQIAENFIKKLAPDKYAQMEKVDWNSNTKAYPFGDEETTSVTFNYVRKVNGVYFLNNGVNITVDTRNGDVTNYKLDWYNKDIPAIDHVISIDDAYKILYDSGLFKLMYLTQYNPDFYINGMPTEDLATPQVKLVYSIISPKYCYIDAATGKLPNIVGSKSYTNACPYTDIKGCASENQIKILYENGIYLEGSKFRPNDLIKQSDFLYLTCQLNSFSKYIGLSQSDTDRIYNFMVSQGVISKNEIAPNKAVTKQDAVKYLIKALGYGKVANYKDIYNLSFKDSKSIKSECIGASEIARALNIVSGVYFTPNKYITRSDAITLLYNSFNVYPINQ